jgi:hypothetical protein
MSICGVSARVDRRRAIAAICVVSAVAFGGGARDLHAQSAVPSPWIAQDIGGPALSGSASYDSGTLTVSAGGAGIRGYADQFHFVYQQVTGDAQIVARVDALSHASDNSKAGVMIRASLAADAAHGLAALTAGNGLRFQRRRATGGSSTNRSADSAAAAPRWVGITRIGTRVSAYTSTDGSSWTHIGTDTIALDETVYVGVAVTSHDAAEPAAAALSQVAVSGLPAPQRHVDVGAPAVKGTAFFSNGTYTVRAGGAAINGTTDQFHFVYQELSGDGEIVARVGSLGNTHGWAKAGVMFRESLAADASHASAFVTPANGYAFQRRTDAGSTSVLSSGGDGAAPGWLKVARRGSTFEAFRSADGISWTSIGYDDVAMGQTALVGLAVSARSATATTTAVFDGVAIAASTPPENAPPTVVLTSPQSTQTFSAPATVTLAATASDPEGRLDRVEFYSGATLLGSANAAPYSFTWASVDAGSYTLSAKAFDVDGAQASSAPVAITVEAANQPPAAALTAPADGAVYTAPATIALTATASDPEGSLTAVEFFAGSSLLGTATTPPFSLTWTAVPAGTYALTAVASDAAGARTTSGVVSVTVAAPPPPPQTWRAVFNASTDHATNVSSYLLEIFAAGADPDTATPVTSSDLGKPTPAANGEIDVDRTSLIGALAPGSYVATVSAIGPGGRSRSAPAAFTR